MNAFKLVFQKISSWVIAVGTSVVVLVLITVIPKYQALGLIFNTEVSFLKKISLSFFELILFFQEHSLTVVLGILTSLLFGINISLAVYYMRFRRLRIREAGVSSVGAVLAMLGLGCGACGSVILVTLLGAFGSSLVATLPLGGMEFGILGLGLLLFSTGQLAKSIMRSGLCEVTK